MATATAFSLPDLLKICDYAWGLHPDYQKVEVESAEWLRKYDVVKDKELTRVLRTSCGLLCSYVYYYTTYDKLRTSTDFMNLLFVIEELTDTQAAVDVKEAAAVFLQALRTGECDGSPFSRMTNEIRQRFLSTAGPNYQRHLLKACTNYLNAVIKEAETREHKEILSLNKYVVQRRNNSGVFPTFVVIEFLLDIDLPDEVYDHPVFNRMIWTAVDMIAWSNDVYSYGKERETGDPNNVIVILMNERGITLQEASDEVGKQFQSFISQFAIDKSCLPTFGDAIDTAVQAYIKGIETWVIGNLLWSFECLRYFGTSHLDVKKTLLVQLK